MESLYRRQTFRAGQYRFSGNKKLIELANRILELPKDLTLQSRVAKIYDDRRKMAAGEQPGDWGFAENLAYATLIDEGHNLRLVGQDSGRGTFFHRHAVLHDQKDGHTFMPLATLRADADVEVIDSLLSEEAVMAFEYGHSTTDPYTLNIWEGQFGDFANGAQVVIDQFISSGESKWNRLCGLALFLPHGYEGQGPEHSSARLERFLQMCAHENMQVCVPTTPAQDFHMIRRQMLRPVRKPLIVMTPKSLLRHKLAVSSLDELANGSFQLVIGDHRELQAKKIKRVVLCSGKVYYDLLEDAEKRGPRRCRDHSRRTAVSVPASGSYRRTGKILWRQRSDLVSGRTHESGCVVPDPASPAGLCQRQAKPFVRRPRAFARAGGRSSEYAHRRTGRAG